MYIFKRLQEKIKNIIETFLPDVDISDQFIQVEMTKDEKYGEITTNIAMVLAKQLKISPHELAEQLIVPIRQMREILDACVAGPGFINMTLDVKVWLNELQQIVALGKAYSDIQMVQNQKVHVEFVSANPTGPMHAGHVRNAVLGDTIASLLAKVGYHVYREYYINDAGGQIDCLARSVYLRYQEALGKQLSPQSFDGNLYPGEYLIPLGEAIAAQDGKRWLDQDEQDWLPVFKQYSVEKMMNLIRDDLEALGVVMDCYTSEKALTDAEKVQEALDFLKNKGDVYEGTLPKPKGHVIEDWEERPQTLFRATKYGDETDRPLRKSDGSWTYFAGDIAYHLDKFQRGFDYMINVLGADHCGYVSRLTSAVKALTDSKGILKVKLFQIVNFFENGVPVKMSKRAGNFITSKDIVDRVGKDATRFMMISRHNSTVIDFDFEKVLEQSQDNPLFYIQYAHARTCSVFRRAREIFPHMVEGDYKEEWGAYLSHSAEIATIRMLACWPKIVEQAATTLEPHRISNYLYTLAGVFHNLWNQGKDSLDLRFIDSQNEQITQAKLFLLRGVATVLSDGLELLGITPVSEMR